MYILLSPAKKMRQQPDLLECRGLPAFSADAAKLLAALQSMTLPQLQRLWRCSDALAQRSFALLQGADVAAARTPALLAYDGIQYQYLSPLSLPDDAVEYLQQHLRILSGLYGVLRPLDAVIPYRLEMQAQLCVGGAPDLYAYWGDRIARSKPYPDIYEAACRGLDVPPQDAFAIEDSYNGIRAAAAAGIRPVMVPDLLPPTDEMRALCHGIFPDLTAFRGFLAQQFPS